MPDNSEAAEKAIDEYYKKNMTNVDEKRKAEKFEVKQNFPFIGVEGELMRIYVYPNNQQIPVRNVCAISVKPDGSHRLMMSDDLSKGMTVQSGWLTIIYQGVAGKPYVFSE